MGISTFSKQTANAGSSNPVGSGNVIINGGFELNQRGFISSTTSGFGFDRWQNVAVGTDGTATFSAQSFISSDFLLNNFNTERYLRIVTSGQTAPNIATFPRQHIEDVRTLAGQTVTFSFWGRVASGTAKIAFELLQSFGVGGSDSVSTTNYTTIDTTWKRYSVTTLLPSIADKTIGPSNHLQANLWVSGSSSGYPTRIPEMIIQNNTFDIWGIQLEAGAVATPFRPVGGSRSLDIVASGSAGYNGVLVARNSETNFSNSGTPAWAGYDVAGKNKIINGAFDIAQRGTSFTSHGYTLDRWQATGATNVATQTISQQALPNDSIPGLELPFFMRHVVTNVNGATAIQFQNKIEDVRTFVGQTATLSFYAKADAPRNVSVVLEQRFGVSGSANNVIATQNFSITTSWARYTATIAVPSIFGKIVNPGNALNVQFNYPLSTFTIDITGVQLEAGTTATSFSRNAPSIQAELAACQRYYWRSSLGSVYNSHALGNSISATQARCFITHPVTMRVPPGPTSVEFSNLGLGVAGISAAAVSAITIAENSERSSLLAVASTGLPTAGSMVILTNNNNTAGFIAFSAEL
jgi:hypothetical protein